MPLIPDARRPRRLKPDEGEPIVFGLSLQLNTGQLGPHGPKRRQNLDIRP